jgi:hypothetical protein
MKLIQVFAIILSIVLFAGNSFAGVFKCTDASGNTTYQSDPCARANKAIEMDIKTGEQTDLADKEKEKALEADLIKQQEVIEKQLAEMKKKRIKDAATQSAQNQQLIKNNPVQYSAFAIPPYLSGKLSDLVKQYEDRLPEIEKFRRLAAFKALATGECKRVESDVLSEQSKSDLLVFAVDCSSAKRFHFNETVLVE